MCWTDALIDHLHVWGRDILLTFILSHKYFIEIIRYFISIINTCTNLSASICGYDHWTDALIDHLHAWGNKLSGDAPAVQCNDTPADHGSISLLNSIHRNTNTNTSTKENTITNTNFLENDTPALQQNNHKSRILYIDDIALKGKAIYIFELYQLSGLKSNSNNCQSAKLFHLDSVVLFSPHPLSH